ncbi:phytase [Chryseolinea soli]|uniref:Phytase n=1 Tax=Chryseolinea soli TaxID=2321403 RepID=A0A385SWN0_9BACT|nr:phytase [Chryseolinea soli]AYB34375.1 phytase [Chryseolinea soli]
MINRLLPALACTLLLACGQQKHTAEIATDAIRPPVVTDNVLYTATTPALWINPVNPEQSLILGTDSDANGGLYAFGLEGKKQKDRCVIPMKQPHSVAVAYGFALGDSTLDIAVVTEATTQRLRAFRLPAMKPIDGGGIAVFEGETGEGFRDPGALALYKQPNTGKLYAFVARKNGPTDGSFVWQYLLENKSGALAASVVRKFGTYSGKKGVPGIVVDATLGYVYYSDAGTGVRKYYADPEKGNDELALFANTGFTENQSGLAIYPATDNTGYILVSDQQANRLQIFSREGTAGNPHQHTLIKTVNIATLESTGSTVSTAALNPTFQSGLFATGSLDRTFHLYRWEDIAGKDLKVVKDSVALQ